MREVLAGMVVAMTGGLCAAGTLNISVVEPEAAVQDLPLVAWVADDDRDWSSGEPLFAVEENASGTSAQVRVAVSDQHIFLHVVVQDDQHVNEQTEAGIWNGDCIQVGIDALGNGSAVMDTNDAALAFALTEQGSEAWAYHLGRRGASGPLADARTEIHRDEAQQVTRYEIAMPWSVFGVQPGSSPVLGLAVQINDTDRQGEQVRLYFGRGAGGVPQPAGFQKLRLGNPVVPVVARHIVEGGLWREGDGRGMVIGLAGMGEVTLRASLGHEQQEHVVAAAEGGIQRFLVRAVPRPLPVEPLEMQVSVTDAAGRRLMEDQVVLQDGGQVFAELNARLDALAAASPHALFTRHLRTVQAVANAEWQLARLQMDDSTAIADHAATVVREILAGLEGDAAEWETYRQRRRKMVMGFMNPADRTVQYYMLSLPRDWQPQRRYPMIVFLHGGGTSHVALDVAAAPFRGAANSTVESRFEGDLDTVYIEPYARGRHGYHGLGERDVLLAVEDARAALGVDPDRIYLTGFSAGGHGAWAVAAHSPDLWAAVCINAGAARSVPVGIGIGRNYLGLPTRIWHGEADPTIPAASGVALAEELRQYGSEPELILAPGVAHDYYGHPHEGENLAWLLTHRRQRPDRFGFTAETRDYLGRHGITLTRDPTVSSTPWFECRVEANQVHLSSGGTPALTVDLGPEGLGMAEEVAVFLEGRQVYTGLPIVLRIDTAEGTATPQRARVGRRSRR